MSDFLVLGLIPGTHIQITFLLWLVGASAVVIALGMYLAHRAHLLRNWLVTTSLILLTRRQPKFID